MDTRQPYDTDLTNAQWRILEPLVPAPAPNGRPVDYPRREIVNAIFYVVRTGCAWRHLPHDFPPWPIVYHYFRRWRRDGTWERINDQLRRQVRRAAGKHAQPSAALLDSQSVKMVDQAGERGFDGGKLIKGRKRHLLVDTLGLLLLVGVTAASVGDRAGATQLLGPAPRRLPRLQLVRADAGYKGSEFGAWVQQHCGWVLEIAEHLVPVHQFEVQPWRWIVERTLGWLNRYRRLSKDYESDPRTSEAMIQVAMIQLMVRRLAAQRAEQRRARRKEKRLARLEQARNELF
jgi:putative transposase